MPYRTNADLPPAVQRLPTMEQTKWRKRWTEVYDRTGDEEQAFRVAWSLVPDQYKKAGDMMTTAKFTFDAPLSRVWKGADNQLYFEGIASSTTVDSQKERMSEKALLKMAQHPPLDIFQTHTRMAGEEIGTTTEQFVTPDNQFIVRGIFFDDNETALRVYKRMSEGRKYGLSVGGTVLDAHWETGKEAGGRVRVLDDIELNHIAITPEGGQANPDCWIGAVAKAIDESGAFIETTETEQAGEDVAPEAILAELDSIIGDLEKVGRRNSTKDTAHIHATIDALRNLCGCDMCAGSIGTETGEAQTEKEAHEMPEEITAAKTETEVSDATAEEIVPDEGAEKTEVSAEATPEEAATETVAAKSDEPKALDVDAVIAKAVEAGRKAGEEDSAAKVAELETELAKAREENEVLKAAPAEGGPEGKPSGEEAKTETPADAQEQSLTKQYIAAGDKESASKALAAELMFGIK